MKPSALLNLDFLTSAGNKCIALVRKSSFSKAQGLHETSPWEHMTGDLGSRYRGTYCRIGEHRYGPASGYATK